VLCSDGLCGPVTDDEIEQITSETSDLKSIASTLIEKANAAGGPDNITVLVVRVMGIPS
jgi:protein phosphatase